MYSNWVLEFKTDTAMEIKYTLITLYIWTNVDSENIIEICIFKKFYKVYIFITKILFHEYFDGDTAWMKQDIILSLNVLWIKLHINISWINLYINIYSSNISWVKLYINIYSLNILWIKLHINKYSSNVSWVKLYINIYSWNISWI